MKFKIRIFDADETLLDYRKSENYALEQMLQVVGCNIAFDEAKRVYHSINDNLWIDYEKGLTTVKNLRIQRFADLMSYLGIVYNAEDVSKIYLSNFAQAGFLMAGADDFLEKLREIDGVNLIISNGSKVTQYGRFFRAGFDDIFDKYIISEELQMKKPDYQIFEYALAPYPEYTKDEIIMIGDSLVSDISGGKNYGIKTCWFNLKKTENTTDIIPDFTVTNYNDLFELLTS
ncbi:MAG: YjjG family noncanonical pyrimidine nucleotidase [Spirochaetes bacterium]|nr:YjjG family noncanonical pyrimidine nucleotidase [Spirochaetota bacterium]